MSLADGSQSQFDSEIGSEESATAANSNPQAVNEENLISKEESKVVARIKAVVLLVLLLSTVGVAVTVYNFTSGAEIAEFEKQYLENAAKIFEAVGTTLAITLGAVDSFSVDLVSYAKYSNSSWPFVTPPDFAIRASKLRGLTKSIVVSVYPKVTEEDRFEWETYSSENGAEWVNKGLKIQEEDESFNGLLLEDWTPSPIIYGNMGPIAYNQSRDYLPTWVQGPVVPIYPPYNWDLAGSIEVQEAVQTVLDTETVVFGKSVNVPDPDDPSSIEQESAYAAWASGFIGEGEDSTEPYSATYYPIVESDIDSVKIQKAGNNTIVGVVALSLFWRNLITDILPPGSDGMVVIFRNACDQEFSYQINGPDVVFLGVGDVHSTDYDHLEQQTSFLNLKSLSEGAQAYSGLPLNENHCQYALHVYPSDDMRNLFTTKNPIIYTLAAVLIFGFTSMVFMVYDCYVERRQKIVLRTAVKSSKVVSSLFPSAVRDRLYAHEEKELNKPKLPREATRMRLQGFLRDGVAEDDPLESAPIAELFQNTTVLFADIAGFTAWSSTRQPTAVFTLLETLYGAFDKIAKQRGVFKVETIGDSYVAVVGLPEPRQNHAVVAARFARDCRNQMKDLTEKLALTLGPDTRDLSMRIGLNSGSVTAGVLRGEKARFQLFGDTVNTAARMESTGQKHRIQASQVTADLIVEADKQHWVTARTDKVEAKGKGVLQTYWIEPKSNGGGSSGQGSHMDSLDGDFPISEDLLLGEEMEI